MRLLKLFVLPLCAAVALSAPLTSATATGAVAQAAKAAAKPPPVPLLWRVSDADNAVYLLGSFHLLRADDYPLSSDIDRAFAASDKLVFEVAPEEMFDPSVGQRFMQRARFEDGRTLSQALPADLREKLNRVLAKNGRSLSQVDALEPWFVNLSLVLGVSQSLGFSPQLGLDQYLMRQAAEAGKGAAGLESMDHQLDVMDASPADEQVKALREFLDQPTEVPGMLEEMHTAWREADLAKLDEKARVEMQQKTPQTYRIVNVERNEAWVPQIQKLLDDQKKGDTLVVVGSLHLLGGDGLVERLRAKGYKIERICSACAAGTPDLAPMPALVPAAAPSVRLTPDDPRESKTVEPKPKR
ncbi:TraB/GumN family protein [Lysobacter sp. K5869]|uniref:TraB/GumN family protein n=1 Tax=Lysobacter sp. K5869 TaxID=2820808 RepID=UPI001C062777|nr:TraB/GumN family protein [Lysobacter sp. K5869]QWP74812.1 TraB/GumN family protein [Lysobacter sp. K5869]